LPERARRVRGSIQQTFGSIPNRNKGEAFPGFPAFPTRESSGWSAIDFLECSQFIAEHPPMAEALGARAIGEPELT